MTVDGRRYGKRAEAEHHTLARLTEEAENQLGFRERTVHAGELGGFPLMLTVNRVMDDAHLRVSFYGAPGTDVALNTTDLAELEPVGLITRLQNRLTHLEAIKAQTLADIDHARSEVSHATANLCKPFPQATGLVGARERVRHIEEQLQAAAAPSHDEQWRDSPRPGRAAC